MNTAFKEWSWIVDALTEGRQTILLRKGGIAEGRGGFKLEHDSFWLYPTRFHESPDKVKPDTTQGDLPPADRVPIRCHATLAQSWEVTDESLFPSLEPFHAWSQEEVLHKFHQGKWKGFHVLLVRVSRLPEPHWIPVLPEYGGCKSWINLLETLSIANLTPVLDDSSFAETITKLEALFHRRDAANAG